MTLARVLNHGKPVVHVDPNAEITLSGAPEVKQGKSYQLSTPDVMAPYP